MEAAKYRWQDKPVPGTTTNPDNEHKILGVLLTNWIKSGA